MNASRVLLVPTIPLAWGIGKPRLRTLVEKQHSFLWQGPSFRHTVPARICPLVAVPLRETQRCFDQLTWAGVEQFLFFTISFPAEKALNTKTGSKEDHGYRRWAQKKSPWPRNLFYIYLGLSFFFTEQVRSSYAWGGVVQQKMGRWRFDEPLRRVVRSETTPQWCFCSICICQTNLRTTRTSWLPPSAFASHPVSSTQSRPEPLSETLCLQSRQPPFEE